MPILREFLQRKANGWEVRKIKSYFNIILLKSGGKDI